MKAGSDPLLSQKAEVSQGISNSGNTAVSRISQAVFSMITAIPCPPPMQADPTAYFPPRRLYRKSNSENYLHL